jgi:hypothetical protein
LIGNRGAGGATGSGIGGFGGNGVGPGGTGAGARLIGNGGVGTPDGFPRCGGPGGLLFGFPGKPGTQPRTT